MANYCEYEMRAVAKSREALERLMNVMRYKDNEMFIYRVFSCDNVCDIRETPDGLFSVLMFGDMAWSITPWFNEAPDPNRVFEETGASYCPLDYVCKKLDVGIEVWAREEGCCFQQHGQINHKGEIVRFDSCDWELDWGEDGDAETPTEKGGFKDYGEYLNNEDIYGRE